MQSIMIIKIYVVHDMCERFDQILEALEVNYLGFQRVIKRFHIRIVPATTLSAFTNQQVMFIQRGFQLLIRKLNAAIRYLVYYPVMPSVRFLWRVVHLIFAQNASR